MFNKERLFQILFTSLVALCVVWGQGSLRGEDNNVVQKTDATKTEDGNTSAQSVSTSQSKKASNSTAKSSDNVSTSLKSCSEVFDEYQEKLRGLAKKCDERGMTLEAKVTRSYLYDEKPYSFMIPLFPTKRAEQKLPDDATSEQKSWYAALLRLRVQYGQKAFVIAERLGSKKRGYDVVAAVLTTLFIDPDHERARNFFGYSLAKDSWRTQWELRQIDKGLVDDPNFGWIPEEHVAKYHEGMRYYRNQWVSAEEEAEKIIASSSGWKIETEHYSILSRVSLERGVEIGRFLESYYQSWSRLYYHFIANENQWTARLYAKDPILTKRHKVILYRNRDEYIRELRKHDWRVEQSVGGYFPSLHCIFVYESSSEDEDEFELTSLLAHEATHQLFNECNIPTSSRGKADYSTLARLANYWAIEGVAIYAETYKINKARTSADLGGYRDVFRVQCALESLFEDSSYIPLQKYSSFSMKEFQSYDDLSLLYSQAAGLTFFFIHYKDGLYRSAFVDYLYLIYQGKDAPNTLEQATGKSFSELDAEYKEFMQEIYSKSSESSKKK